MARTRLGGAVERGKECSSKKGWSGSATGHLGNARWAETALGAKVGRLAEENCHGKLLPPGQCCFLELSSTNCCCATVFQISNVLTNIMSRHSMGEGSSLEASRILNQSAADNRGLNLLS